LLLSVVVLAGCGAHKVERPEYADVLAAWTRSARVYKGLESRLYISATYKNPVFREAYIERYAESYGLDDDYKQVLLKREADEMVRYNEFFLSAYTPEERWNDFERPDSAWKLYLEDGSGARLSPISITKVDTTDPLLREFFPYLDLWSSGYIVKFPKYSETGAEPIPGEKTEYVRLVVTGVLGRGRLEWRLKH